MRQFNADGNTKGSTRGIGCLSLICLNCLSSAQLFYTSLPVSPSETASPVTPSHVAKPGSSTEISCVAGNYRPCRLTPSSLCCVADTVLCHFNTVALCPAVWPSLRRCPSCGVPARRCSSADCSKTSAQDRSNTGALRSSLTHTPPCPE